VQFSTVTFLSLEISKLFVIGKGCNSSHILKYFQNCVFGTGAVNFVKQCCVEYQCNGKMCMSQTSLFSCANMCFGFWWKETYPSVHNYILSVSYVMSNGRKIVGNEMGCIVHGTKQS
jgi:hypothetical protein